MSFIYEKQFYSIRKCVLKTINYTIKIEVYILIFRLGKRSIQQK